MVKRILRKYGYPPDKQEKATQTVLERETLHTHCHIGVQAGRQGDCVRPLGFVVAVFVIIMFSAPAVAQKPGSADPGKSSAKPAAQAEEAFKKAEAFGEKNNFVEAMRWYRVAADQGHLESQNNVGMFYVAGMGVVKDVAEGARWLRKAADRGHEVAQRNLGFLYLQGIGVRQDRAEAIRWLRKAADQGDEEAKTVLKKLGQ